MTRIVCDVLSFVLHMALWAVFVPSDVFNVIALASLIVLLVAKAIGLSTRITNENPAWKVFVLAGLAFGMMSLEFYLLPFWTVIGLLFLHFCLTIVVSIVSALAIRQLGEAS